MKGFAFVLVAGALAGASFVFGNTAEARTPVASEMTCAQTQAYKARYGRVWVLSGDQIVPIWGDRSCGHGMEAHPLFVRTLDTKSCVIGYRCYSRSSD